MTHQLVGCLLVLFPFLPVCVLGQEAWNPAVNLGPNVNSPSTEKASYITADGQTLYFCHNSAMGDINIFYSQWTGTEWGPPVDIGLPINSPQNDWGPTLTPDGNKLYFASDRPGGYGSYDIYVTERIGNVWQQPVNLGPVVNSSDGELGQDINADDTVLWFSRGWPEPSPTDEDIYYSLKVDGDWTTPVKWEWDTDELEDNPNISADGNKLYFTAIYDTLYGGGYGSFDIWMSERIGGVWQQPVNLGPEINTAEHDANPSISADGNTLHFTSKRTGGYGYFDLYSATRDTATEACLGASTVPALVTVETSGPEQFVVRVTDQLLLDEVIDICLGHMPQRIVVSDLVTGNVGYNRDPLSGVPWSWHLDEAGLTLAEMTIELCDGRPSDVEGGLLYWIKTVGAFCPWSSRIVAIASDTALAGDFDIDGDVDLGDFAILGPCMTGPIDACYAMPARCCAADTDGDGDLDLLDFALLQGIFSSEARRSQ